MRRDLSMPGSRGRRRARWRALVPLLAVAALLAGCSTMPNSGPVMSENQPGMDQNNNSRVQVFPQPPYPGEPPEQIIDGFLEALASSDPVTDNTARAYLTPAAAATWQPTQGAEIVQTLTQPRVVDGSTASGAVQLSLPVTPVAYLDADLGGYAPAGASQTQSVGFAVVRSGGQWRISEPPRQLIISELDFQRVFQPVDLYYLSALGGEHHELVPDRIYLRDDSGTPQAALSALFAGPSGWLAPGIEPKLAAAASRFTVASVSEISGVATVTIKGDTDALSATLRTELSAEVYWTLSKLSGVALGGLVLQDAKGRPVATADGNAMAPYDPDALSADPVAYLLQPVDHNSPGAELVRDGDVPRPLSGDFGTGAFRLRSAAVAPDGGWAAGVSVDGRTLAVQDIAADGHAEVVFTGANLSEPSWDGAGDLWVVDHTPTGAVVHEVLHAEHTPASGGAPPKVQTVPVDVRGFTAQGGPAVPASFTVSTVRVATDGTRVVVVAALPLNQSVVLTGVVAPAPVPGNPDGVSITNLRSIIPQMTTVTAAVWDGPRRLAVLGPEPYLVDVDGGALTSVSSPPSTPVCIAAAQPDLPNPLPLLVADGAGTLYEYQPGTSTVWTREGQGICPLYPA